MKGLSNQYLYKIISEYVAEHDDGQRLTMCSLDVASLVVMTGYRAHEIRKALKRLESLLVIRRADVPERGGWRELWTTSKHWDDVVERRHGYKR